MDQAKRQMLSETWAESNQDKPCLLFFQIDQVKRQMFSKIKCYDKPSLRFLKIDQVKRQMITETFSEAGTKTCLLKILQLHR